MSSFFGGMSLEQFNKGISMIEKMEMTKNWKPSDDPATLRYRKLLLTDFADCKPIQDLRREITATAQRESKTYEQVLADKMDKINMNFGPFRSAFKDVVKLEEVSSGEL